MVIKAASKETEKSSHTQEEESVGSESAPPKSPTLSIGAKWRSAAGNVLSEEKQRKVSLENEDSTRSGNSYWNTLDVDHNGGAKNGHPRRSKSRLQGLVKAVLEKSVHSGDQDLLFTPVRPYIIHPASDPYQYYEYCFIPFVFWTGWSAPFIWAFLNVGQAHPLSIVDYVVDFLFAVDIALTFRVAFIEKKTYLVVDEPKRIAKRYLRGTLIPDVLANFPYHAFGTHQWVRWLTLFKLWRLRRIGKLFSKLEKDIRINYFIARVTHLYLVVVFVAHCAACIMYQLAVSYPDYKRDSTWIALLFEDTWKDRSVFDKYCASIYWSLITLTTTGYGDFHPNNVGEFIFCAVYVLVTMAITSYVLGNMTAIIVKLSSRVQDYRDSISALDGFVARNRLPHHLRRQMKRHARLKFETEDNRSDIIREFPKSIRARISRYLYRELVQNIYLFGDCSREFVSTLVGDVKVEWYMPGEVIINERDAPTIFYILATGKVDIITTLSDGSEEVLTSVEEGDLFGEIGVLCNMPQPFMCRASQLTKVLRIDRNDFSDVVQSYVKDGSQVVTNLLERTKNEDDVLAMKLSAEIVSLIKQQEAELTMTLVYVASRGDLVHLQKLMHGGVDPNKADYDGRTPLHLAASKGFDEIIRFLIREGADVNCKDNFGTTPLNEALKAGQDDSARLLWENGARLSGDKAGTEMCEAAAAGNVDYLKRLLEYGANPDSADYDFRTALHIAAAEGYFLVAKLLVDSGANVLFADRWGHTAIDEARSGGHMKVVDYLEAAMAKLAEPTELADKDGGTPRAPHVAASEKRIKQRLERLASLKQEAPHQRSLSGRKLIHSGSPLEAMLTAHTSSMSSRGGDLTPQAPVVAMAAAAQGVGKSLTQRAWQDVEGGYTEIRDLGRHSPPLVHEPAVRRVTVRRGHPGSGPGAPGRVMRMPRTLQELLAEAGRAFDFQPTLVFNEKGGLITDADLILDNDVVYVSETEEKLPEALSQDDAKALLAKIQALLG